ncbi:4F2 cell-surface antigen heavy chain [Oncorhynchus mykiss]|uniref:Glycosyl hydrolase family 13 catalytic domain-containing protein n=1 Tax=Oncorhynchus mykiss TaxID=8022 RepID=A0A8C7RM89_ONCMY|nr:4F2 cell-surface antigen heavy chain [Oncorhynchus mykiss]
MSKDTEVDMKDVELNELDQEKLPMTGDGPGAEKNGNLKQKEPEEDVKFTGLSKEELMKVAGTPGWVRTRWVLLVLFWLGWVGMLAGAIVIIVQAPRCKPIPEMNWWNQGPLYQIADLDAFNHDKGIKGVVEVLDSLNQLKVKGLVLGPLHTVQQDKADTLDLVSMDPRVGTDQDLLVLLDKAHKKGISVVLNLTPNPGADPWFSPDHLPKVLDKLRDAAEHWLGMGVDGVQVCGLAAASASSDWSKFQGVVQGNRTEVDVKKRALIGVVDGQDYSAVSQLLNSSGVDLILSDVLNKANSGIERAKSIHGLVSTQKQSSLAWGLGGSLGNHLASVMEKPDLVRLYQLMLFTLPGTPVFNYGDELGLVDQGSTSPKMPWDTEEEVAAEGAVKNETAEAQKTHRLTCRSWFKTLSDLRGKERSLLHGDYFHLHSSSASLAFLRLWDQSERYLTAVNWGSATLTMALNHTELSIPEQAKVKLSTDPENLAADSSVSLDKLLLGPGQAVLLTFPFA